MWNQWRGQEPCTLPHSQAHFHVLTLSLSFTLILLPRKAMIVLLSAAFSRASCTQTLLSIQKRLWCDIFPPFFCGSDFWVVHRISYYSSNLSLIFLKWREPNFPSNVLRKGDFVKVGVERSQLRRCFDFEISWWWHKISACENKRLGLSL